MRVACPNPGFFLSALLICFHAPPVAAQDKALQVAQKVPYGIHFVSAGGYWQHQKEEGFFRVVVVSGGVELVSHSLFIQWLRTDADSQSYALERTLNVKELNLGHGYVFEVKTHFGDMNAFKIDVTANHRDAKPRTFTITAKGDGSYYLR